MKIEVNRSLQPQSHVLQNRRGSGFPFLPSSFDLGITIPNHRHQLNPAALIETLETIAHDNSETVIGFHKSKKDPTDLIFGKKAGELAASIREKNYIASSVIGNITNFLSTYFLVRELQTVAKERGQKFGLSTEAVLPEDKELAKKATELASSIAKNPHSINIEDGKEFLKTIGIITLLEKVANQKLEAGSLLLSNTKRVIEGEDLEIGGKAKSLALELKQDANSLTVSKAKQFLQSQNLSIDDDGDFSDEMYPGTGRRGILIPSFF